MRVAFDVKGTLDGYHQAKIRKLFDVFKFRGHTVVVWSSVLSMAAKWANALDVECCTKYSKVEAQEQELPFFDVAVEDDYSSSYLATRFYAWVQDVPEADEELEEFVRKYEELCK